MKMSNLFDDAELEIDEIKLRKMRYKIYLKEKEFYKTRRYTVQGIKDEIRKIIISEHKKNIGG